MQKFIFSFFFLNCFFCLSQVKEHPFVKLSTEENGKRLEFYATNTDSIGYSIFLRIVTEDYRRTSNRPILTNIEPNSKIHLITLIKLSGSGGEYTHRFIVNKATQAISFRKDYDKVGDDFNYAFNAKRIVIYQRNDSKVAVDAKMLFLKYKIPFEIYSFKKLSAQHILVQSQYVSVLGYTSF